MSEWRTRFHKHYKQLGEDECWEWASSKSEAGYGRFMLNGKARIASRLAYQIANGPISDDACVMHRCDNRACVNPSHLTLGTHQENMTDRNRKGRARGGSNKGESHPRARLRREDVGAIRSLALYGEMTQAAIAALYGISQPHVSEIKNGKYW